MATVTFRRASCTYVGASAPAVNALDLHVADGEFLVLVGPSGCGKSTSLRMLAGLEPVTSGAVLIGQRDVTDVPPKARDIAMVFQNYALYPHMTVAENIGFALKIRGVPRVERARQVLEAARLLGLEDYLDRRPAALSGGQRQRVAMGRAIVRAPQVFLMDEPLSNLDAKLRVQTRVEIASLQRRLGTTTVYVTHDQVEAMTMGDRVAVLQDGVLQQVETPRRLYDEPVNMFVAGFIGSPVMNLLQCEIVESGITLGGRVVPINRALLASAARNGAKTVIVGFRPDSLEPTSAGEGLAMTVAVVEELGSEAYAYGLLRHQQEGAPVDVDIVARVDARRPPARGETLQLQIRPGEEHLFSASTGERVDARSLGA
jgi:multiple sugar transport system ATP-binding protein